MNMPFGDLPSQNPLARDLLHTARLLAVIAVGSTGVALVMEFFGTELRRSWTAWRGNHVVICGFSAIGRWLVDEFCRAGDKVLVVGQDIGDVGIVSALQSGASVLIGDLGSQRTLRRASVSRAAYFISAADDDTANVGAYFRVAEIMRDGSITLPAHLKVFIHIADPQLRVSLRQWPLSYKGDPKPPRAGVFSVFDNSARLLLHNHPLDYVGIREDDERAVQVVIIGLGRMGEAVLIRAAQAGHYANGRRLRATVIDLQASKREILFRSRYPNFHEVCDAEFLTLDAEEPSTLKRIADLCSEPNSVTTVVVAVDRDTQALSLASSLTDYTSLNVPIRIRLNEGSGLAFLTTFSDGARGPSRQITTFGSFREACARGTLIDEELDVMARAMHEDYVRRRRQDRNVSSDDRNLRDWEHLDDDLLESNRQQADHIPVKARAIGCHIVPRNNQDPGTLVVELSEHEVKLLGKMEHQRWMAERYLAGWVAGPLNYDKRMNPYLVDWKELPPDIQQYDLDFARILPGILELVGLELRR